MSGTRITAPGQSASVTVVGDGTDVRIEVWVPGAPPESMNAVDVFYDNTSSGLSAADVQAAIDELAAGGAGGGPVVLNYPTRIMSNVDLSTAGPWASLPSGQRALFLINQTVPTENGGYVTDGSAFLVRDPQLVLPSTTGLVINADNSYATLDDLLNDSSALPGYTILYSPGVDVETLYQDHLFYVHTSDDLVTVNRTPTNYSASGFTLFEHLDGIDAALAGAGGGSFVSWDFTVTEGDFYDPDTDFKLTWGFPRPGMIAVRVPGVSGAARRAICQVFDNTHNVLLTGWQPMFDDGVFCGTALVGSDLTITVVGEVHG